MTRIARLALSIFTLVSAIALAAMMLAESGPPKVQVARAPGKLTFNKDIASIVFGNCAVCHHPGGAAPFSLLSYQEVKKRAQQMVTVTQSRYMPPWLPEPGFGEFVGERRLRDEQIGAIAQWVEQGAAEGDPSDLPPAPKFNEGWQLGAPDMVVKMDRSYTLRASGTDVFRNFVLPIPVPAARFIKAIEMLPGNKKIVHHANILVDRQESSRRLDEQDSEVGFGGMDIKIESERFEPQTHFLFWKPGTLPTPEPEGMAWRLDKGADLVLNMHLQPSGKPEMIQPAVGLYFTGTPPTKFPMLLQLEHDGALDIPPGEKNFVVTDELELPLDVEVLGIYPHAHYLGKDIQGYATLPDGTKEWLVWIKDWDLNWQAVYHYVNPIFLPKGTILFMRWTYDNSAENVRNPNHPPQRVVGGNRSSDEMSHLWVQVLPRNREDLKFLQLALMQQRLRKYPEDFEAFFNLGAVLQSLGKHDEAIKHLRAALKVRPDDATAHNNLGAAFQSLGRYDEALDQFRQALKVRPDYIDAHYNLGTLLLSRGDAEEALSHFREVLQVKADDADAHSALGSALALRGNLVEAAAHFEDAVRINPEHFNAHYNLGYVYTRQGDLTQAAAHYERALQINPQSADTHNDLGSVLAQQGNLAQAAAHFEQALRINPDHADAHNNLGFILARQGNLVQAVAHYERALRIDPQNTEARKNLAAARTQLEKHN